MPEPGNRWSRQLSGVRFGEILGAELIRCLPFPLCALPRRPQRAAVALLQPRVRLPLSKNFPIPPVSHSVWVLTGILTLTALGLYVYTAAPGLTLVDSGELALACLGGGVAHPPGFPLYLLLGSVCAAVSPENGPRCLNLMSALFVAFSVGSLFLAGERLLAVASRGLPNDAARRYGAALIGALTFMTSRNPWTWSGVTEVYALNLVLLTASWALAWVVVGRLTHSGSMDRGPARRPQGSVGPWLFLSLLLATLGLANHHATALPLFPTLCLTFFLGPPGLRQWKKLLLVSIGAGVLLVLGLYGYLRMAAAADPGLGWGGIRSLPLLWRHVMGQQYQSQLGFGPESVEVAGQFFQTLLAGCGLPAALLLGLGILISFGKRQPWPNRALVMGVPLSLVVFNLLLSLSYIAGPEDRMAYDLPATAAGCLLVGIGAWSLLGRIRMRPALVWVALMALVTTGWNLAKNFDLCNLRQERTARIFVQEMLQEVPEDSLVLTSEWNFYAPFLYMKHIENYRPELRVIDVLMMRRFWYLDYLERTLPGLVAQSRQEFEDFRREASRFDLGMPYDRVNIQKLYDNLIHRWIAIAKNRGGAFVDWACLDRDQERSWIRPLKLIPEGLLLRFVDDRPRLPPEPIPPKDSAHLRYLWSRLKPGPEEHVVAPLAGRFDPYRKVWMNYQRAVEAHWLSVMQRSDDSRLAEHAQEYAQWYPAMDLSLRNVRSWGRR